MPKGRGYIEEGGPTGHPVSAPLTLRLSAEAPECFCRGLGKIAPGTDQGVPWRRPLLQPVGWPLRSAIFALPEATPIAPARGRSGHPLIAEPGPPHQTHSKQGISQGPSSLETKLTHTTILILPPCTQSNQKAPIQAIPSTPKPA